MNILHEEIKELIIKSLDLEDINPADIDPDAPLFGDGLGLDSIDALELGVAIKKQYGITLSAEDKDNRKHFQSVASLSEFISSQRTTN